MLQLKNIVKDYATGDLTVRALKGVDLTFRDSEFVSVLGPSGCGKTTLLNIVGGLDVYTSGDLIINGRSTKDYKDADWDTYRNHSIGFVFQSYNLIPHQTVLANVELALTLSGVSKEERRKRAVEALEKVGLGDQLHKKPNQMSGGQMQRVAIARALVNNPDILLADEPTGALDTETSVAIMNILKEISKDKLIIMVTHNPDLANEYSTRIVRLLDGSILDDSNPVTEEELAAQGKKEETEEAPKVISAKAAGKAEGKGKKSMSFFTALSLSFTNLMTKRARTLLTSFAGSIGIIGIALILAVSNGVNAYIASVQRDTLSSYPISILSEENDIGALLGATADTQDRPQHEDDGVYSNPQLYELFNALVNTEKKQNNLTAFKAFLDKEMNEATASTELRKFVSAIKYNYSVPINAYVLSQHENKYIPCDLASGLHSAGDGGATNESFYNMLSMNLSAISLWEEMLPGKGDELISDMVYDQYDLLYGEWPTRFNEIVLVVDKNNEISDMVFYALGYTTEEEISKMLAAAMSGQTIPFEDKKLSYDEVLDISMKVLLPADFYEKNTDGLWQYIGDNEAVLSSKMSGALNLKISGVIRQNEDATAGSISTPFAYTSALTQYLIKANSNTDVVKAQSDPANENYDIFTGLPFFISEENELTDEVKAEKIKNYFALLTPKEKAEIYTAIVSTPSQAEIDGFINGLLAQYDTPDKMAEMILTFAKSFDLFEDFSITEEQLKAYLQTYSPEELRTFFAESAAAMFVEQYATDKKAELDTLMATPSKEDVDALVTVLTSLDPSLAAVMEMYFGVSIDLSTKQGQMQFIIADWVSSTTLSAQEVAAHLMSLDDEGFTAAFRASVAKLYPTLKEGDSLTSLCLQVAKYDIMSKKYEKVSARFDAEILTVTDIPTLAAYYDDHMPAQTSDSTLEDRLRNLGVVSEDTPSSIMIYATTFENKDEISKIISAYNQGVEEKDKIEYTDYIALLLSGVTKIINAISYVLIAFVSISLVVSSIMIGIITYISVLERTKEIGILRAIGASKKDVSLVFNAETIIVGLAAGLIGIGVSLILCIPINMIIHYFSGIDTLSAFLEPLHAIVLVAISVLLTMISGLFPSRVAAKKDPVEALRTE